MSLCEVFDLRRLHRPINAPHLLISNFFFLSWKDSVRSRFPPSSQDLLLLLLWRIRITKVPDFVLCDKSHDAAKVVLIPDDLWSLLQMGQPHISGLCVSALTTDSRAHSSLAHDNVTPRGSE